MSFTYILRGKEKRQKDKYINTQDTPVLTNYVKSRA